MPKDQDINCSRRDKKMLRVLNLQVDVLFFCMYYDYVAMVLLLKDVSVGS